MDTQVICWKWTAASLSQDWLPYHQVCSISVSPWPGVTGTSAVQLTLIKNLGASYIVSGIQSGFRVAFDYSCSCTKSSRNMALAGEHSQVVRDYLANECSAGRVIGPLPPGSIFRFVNGRFLTRDRLVIATCLALWQTGMDESRYAGHSFSIGEAMTAALNAVPDSLIRTLGSWESSVYNIIHSHSPRNTLCGGLDSNDVTAG